MRILDSSRKARHISMKQTDAIKDEVLNEIFEVLLYCSPNLRANLIATVYGSAATKRR